MTHVTRDRLCVAAAAGFACVGVLVDLALLAALWMLVSAVSR